MRAEETALPLMTASTIPPSPAISRDSGKDAFPATLTFMYASPALSVTTSISSRISPIRLRGMVVEVGRVSGICPCPSAYSRASVSLGSASFVSWGVVSRSCRGGSLSSSVATTETGTPWRIPSMSTIVLFFRVVWSFPWIFWSEILTGLSSLSWGVTLRHASPRVTLSSLMTNFPRRRLAGLRWSSAQGVLKQTVPRSVSASIWISASSRPVNMFPLMAEMVQVPFCWTNPFAIASLNQRGYPKAVGRRTAATMTIAASRASVAVVHLRIVFQRIFFIGSVLSWCPLLQSGLVVIFAWCGWRALRVIC